MVSLRKGNLSDLEGKLTKSDLDELVKYLRPVKEKWHEIGQDLGLSTEDLDSISNCDQEEEENLRSVLKLCMAKEC